MHWRWAALLFLCIGFVSAQTTAIVRGDVADVQGSPAVGAVVRLENVLTGFSRQVTTEDDGSFQIANIPLQTYVITALKDGFAPFSQPISLRTNVPQEIKIRLELATQLTRVEVTATDVAALVDPEGTGTRTELNAAAMNQLPVAPTSRGLESVLLTFPGFAANANGAIHPRGAHNQMTYVIDGMPVSDQLTGAFANAVDPSIVQTVELFTGNVPAEYGNKVSGVAVITTRSGMGTGRRFSGSTQVTAAQFDTLASVTQFAGGTDKWGYFGSFNALKSNRYLDQVSLDNLHNGGNSERSFFRADYQASSRDQLRFSFITGRSSFQIANLRSQHAHGQDQRQALRDVSFSMGWLHTINSRTTVDAMASFRKAEAELIPSAGDFPVTASQDRSSSTYTTGVRLNRDTGRHSLRTGVDYQHFPVRERFTFGSAEFLFAKALAGNLYSLICTRYAASGAVDGDARTPIRCLSIPERGQSTAAAGRNRLPPARTGTVLRASYNRTYQTPPNENLLLSSSEEAATWLNRAFVTIRPERQNVYEVGLQQAIGRWASVNGAFYHKDSRDLQDNDNFLNTGIIFRHRLHSLEPMGQRGASRFYPAVEYPAR